MPKGQGHITIRRRPKDGTDGKDGVSISIDTSSRTFIYNSDKTLLNGSFSTNVRLYNGTMEVPPASVTWSASSSDDGSTEYKPEYYLSYNGILTVSNVKRDGYITIHASYGGVNYTVKFIYTREVREATYSLLVSPKAITYKKGETAESVTIRVQRSIEVSNGAKEITTLTSLPTGMSVSINGNVIEYSSSGYTFTPAAETYYIRLVKDQNLIGTETVVVSMVEDGTPGEPGKGISSQTEYYAVGTATTVPTTGWQAGTPPAFTSEYKYLWKYTYTVYTDGTTDTTPEGIVGAYGDTGLTYRTSKWMAGTIYHNDNKPFYRDENGLGYVDVVLTTDMEVYDAQNPPDAWQCSMTHKAAEATDTSVDPPLYPLPDGDANAAWTKLNATAPIITSFILASKIRAGVIDVDDLTADRAFIQNLVARKLIAGTPNTKGQVVGQRVEISPDSKSMDIYDKDGDRVQTIEGNSYTALSSLFGTDDDSFTIQTRTKTEYGYASGITLGKGTYYPESYPELNSAVEDTIDIPISDVKQTSGPVKVSIGAGEIVAYASTGAKVAAQKIGQAAQAQIDLRIKTYSDAACTLLIDVNYLGATAEATANGYSDSDQMRVDDLASQVVRLSAGYHKVFLHIYLNMVGLNSQAYVTWGKSVVIQNISYNGIIYTSRYFANGFCLGTRSDNYIFAYQQSETAGMRFVMENSGYGIDVSKNGIKIKHNSGNWLSMPLLLGRFLVECKSNGTTVTHYLSWDGSNFTSSNVRRSATGIVSVTFPWQNTIGLSASNIDIQATPYLVSATSGQRIFNTVQVRNVSATGFTLYLAEGTSLADNTGAYITIYKIA